MRIIHLGTLLSLLLLIAAFVILFPLIVLSHELINNKQDINLTREFIDLRDKVVTLEQLKDIWEEVNNNPMLGHILWGSLPEGASELQEKIESKVIENNIYYRRFPNDFIHALLSAHVYKDSRVGSAVQFEPNERNSIYNQYLTEWIVYKVYNFPTYGGYYAVLYINNNKKQLVLAHRGTTIQLRDLITTDSAVKTDLAGILGREIVAHQVAAYQVTKEVAKDIKELRYNLSTTGHSLGAWLAELSVYFCYHDFECFDVQAVTFDSPGSVIHMEHLQSNIINHVTKFDVRDLKIVTYLSAPNLVNSCNQHVGRIYRLFPKITKPDTVQKLTGWLNWLSDKLGMDKKNNNTMEGVWSIFGHSLDAIIATFDPDSGKPIKYYEVMDWPVVKYTPKFKYGKTLISDLFDSASTLFTPVLLTNLKDSIQDSTIMTFLTIIGELANGNLDQTQYLSYFKHIEEDISIDLEKNGYEVREQLSDNEQFSLNYEGHYRTKLSTLTEDVLDADREKTVDWYLKELKKRSLHQLGTGLTKKQLATLKDQYIIIHNNKDIISSSTAMIGSIRELMLRLINVNPEVRDILDNNPIPTITSLPTEVMNDDIVASYLPKERVSNFVEQKDVFSTIDKFLSTEQFLIITGLAGTGKSSHALEYGYKKKNSTGKERKIVRWFNASSVDNVNIGYHTFASELEVIMEGDLKSKQLLINLVNNKLSNSKTDILFIFNNVNEYSSIQDYIINLPQKVKVLIISRDINLSDNIKQLRLNPFGREEAREYIQKSLADLITSAEQEMLVRVLETKDGKTLPHKLSQAVAYIKNHEFTPIERCIQEIITNSNTQTLTDILLQSLNSSPMAWDIIQYASYLDNNFISVEIFKEIFMVDDYKLMDAIRKLASLSLITISDRKQRGIKMDRLVQEEVAEYITKYPKNRKIIRKAIAKSRLLKVFNNLFPQVTRVPGRDWEFAEILYPHVVKVVHLCPDNNSIELAELYSKLSKYHQYVLNTFEQALEYSQTALRIKLKLFQKNNLSIAESLYNVGWVYYLLGDMHNSLKFHQQALEMRQALYQGNHPDIAKSLCAVGEAYYGLGKIQKALGYYQQSLKMRQALYQGNHPDTAQVLTNIGLAYSNLMDTEKGLTFQKQALEMRQALYKGNHPDIAQSLGHVGSSYNSAGNIKQGLIFQKQALEMYQNLYQGNHPKVALLLNSVGYLLTKLGNFTEGLVLQENALKMQQELYHGNHLVVAQTLNELGTSYYLAGNLERALVYNKQALEMFKVLVKNNHPYIITSLRNIGIIYQSMGEEKQAQNFSEQALKMKQELDQETRLFE